MQSYGFSRVGLLVGIWVTWALVIGGAALGIVNHTPIVCVPLVIGGIITHALLRGVAAIFDLAEHAETIAQRAHDANMKLAALLERQPKATLPRSEEQALQALIEADRKILGR